MIRAAKLIALLQKVPPDACVSGYEGEDDGIVISTRERTWWIRTKSNDTEDDYTEGFDD